MGLLIMGKLEVIVVVYFGLLGVRVMFFGMIFVVFWLL